MKNTKTKKIITGILLVVCVIVLSVALYNLIEIQFGYSQAKGEYDHLRNNYLHPSSQGTSEAEGLVIDWDKLLALNPDIVGWIEVPGTNISYPVLHGQDNYKYLHHTFDGTQNSAGSIFMDYLNQPDFTSHNTVLHGHNMKDGSMFAGLAKFMDAGYRDEHNEILIHTPDNIYHYTIFEAKQTDIFDTWYQTDFANDDAFHAFAAGKQAPVPDEGERVILLSTCTNVEDDDRYIVLGVLKEIEPVV